MSKLANKEFEYDLFISNAEEDYESIVVHLMEELGKRELSMWQSEQMTLGDNLITSLYKALDSSAYAVVIISPDYLKDPMIREQLITLLMQEYVGDGKRVLPIWHNLKQAEIMKVLPMMATRKSINTKEGLYAIVDAILQAIRGPLPPPPPIQFDIRFATLSGLIPEELRAKITTLREVEKIKVEDADTYSCLGHHYMALHGEVNYTTALGYFKKSMAAEPHNADYPYFCALSMLKGNPALALAIGEAREVEKYLLQALELNDKSSHFHLFSAYMVEEFFDYLSAKTGLNTVTESARFISELNPHPDEAARLNDHLIVSQPHIVNLFQNQLAT